MNSFPIYTPNYPKKIREFVPKKLAAKKNRRFDHIVGMDFNPSYFENISKKATNAPILIESERMNSFPIYTLIIPKNSWIRG